MTPEVQEFKITSGDVSYERLAYNTYRFLCNYIPPYSIYKLLHSYLKTPAMKELFGEVKVYRNSYNSNKTVNGVASSAYKESDEKFVKLDKFGNRQKVGGVDFSLTGSFMPEMDLFLHEIDRYMGTMLPDHYNDLVLLTEEEILSEYSSWCDFLGHEHLIDAVSQNFSNEDMLLKLYCLTCYTHERLISPDNGRNYSRLLSSLNVKSTNLPIYELVADSFDKWYDDPYIKCFTSLQSPFSSSLEKGYNYFFRTEDIAKILIQIKTFQTNSYESQLSHLEEQFYKKINELVEAKEYSTIRSGDFVYCISDIHFNKYTAFEEIIKGLAQLKVNIGRENLYLCVNGSAVEEALEETYHYDAKNGLALDSSTALEILFDYINRIRINTSTFLEDFTRYIYESYKVITSQTLSNDLSQNQGWSAIAKVGVGSDHIFFEFERKSGELPTITLGQELKCLNLNFSIKITDIGDFYYSGKLVGETNFKVLLEGSDYNDKSSFITALSRYENSRLAFLGVNSKYDYDFTESQKIIKSQNEVREAIEIADFFSKNVGEVSSIPIVEGEDSFYGESAVAKREASNEKVGWRKEVDGYTVHTIEDGTLLLNETSTKVFGYMQFFKDFESFKNRNTFSIDLDKFENFRLSDEKITHVSIEEMDPSFTNGTVLHKYGQKDFWSSSKGGYTEQMLYADLEDELGNAYHAKVLENGKWSLNTTNDWTNIAVTGFEAGTLISALVPQAEHEYNDGTKKIYKVEPASNEDIAAKKMFYTPVFFKKDEKIPKFDPSPNKEYEEIYKSEVDSIINSPEYSRDNSGLPYYEGTDGKRYYDAINCDIAGEEVYVKDEYGNIQIENGYLQKASDNFYYVDIHGKIYKKMKEDGSLDEEVSNVKIIGSLKFWYKSNHNGSTYNYGQYTEDLAGTMYESLAIYQDENGLYHRKGLVEIDGIEEVADLGPIAESELDSVKFKNLYEIANTSEDIREFEYVNNSEADQVLRDSLLTTAEFILIAATKSAMLKYNALGPDGLSLDDMKTRDVLKKSLRQRSFWQRKDDDYDQPVVVTSSSLFEKIALNPLAISSKDGIANDYLTGSLIGSELLFSKIALNSDSVTPYPVIENFLSYFTPLGDDFDEMKIAKKALAEKILKDQVFVDRYNLNSDKFNVQFSLPLLKLSEESDGFIKKYGEKNDDDLITAFNVNYATVEDGESKVFWTSSFFSSLSKGFIADANILKISSEKTGSFYVLFFTNFGVNDESANLYVYGGDDVYSIINGLQSLTTTIVNGNLIETTIMDNAIFERSIFKHNVFPSKKLKIYSTIKNGEFRYYKKTDDGIITIGDPLSLKEIIYKIAKSRSIFVGESEVEYRSKVIDSLNENQLSEAILLESILNKDSFDPTKKDILVSSIEAYTVPYLPSEQNELQEFTCETSFNGKIVGAKDSEDGQTLYISTVDDLTDFAAALEYTNGAEIDFSNSIITSPNTPAKIEDFSYFRFNFGVDITPAPINATAFPDEAINKFKLTADGIAKLAEVASVNDTARVLIKRIVKLADVTDQQIKEALESSALRSERTNFFNQGITFEKSFISDDGSYALVVGTSDSGRSAAVLKLQLRGGTSQQAEIFVEDMRFNKFDDLQSYYDYKVEGFIASEDLSVAAVVQIKEDESSIPKVLYEPLYGNYNFEEKASLDHPYDKIANPVFGPSEFFNNSNEKIVTGFTDGTNVFPRVAIKDGTKEFDIAELDEEQTNGSLIVMLSSVGRYGDDNEKERFNLQEEAIDYQENVEQQQIIDWENGDHTDHQPIVQSKYALYASGDGLSSLATKFVADNGGVVSAKHQYFNTINNFELDLSGITADETTDPELYAEQVLEAYSTNPKYTFNKVKDHQNGSEVTDRQLEVAGANVWVAENQGLGIDISQGESSSSIGDAIFNYGGFDRVYAMGEKLVCVSSILNKVFVYDPASKKLEREIKIFNAADTATSMNVANTGNYIYLPLSVNALKGLIDDEGENPAESAVILYNTLSIIKESEVDKALVKRAALSGEASFGLPTIKIGLGNNENAVNLKVMPVDSYSSLIPNYVIYNRDADGNTTTVREELDKQDIAYQNVAGMDPEVGGLPNDEGTARSIYEAFDLDFDDDDVWLVRLKTNGLMAGVYEMTLASIQPLMDNGNLTDLTIAGSCLVAGEVESYATHIDFVNNIHWTTSLTGAPKEVTTIKNSEIVVVGDGVEAFSKANGSIIDVEQKTSAYLSHPSYERVKLEDVLSKVDGLVYNAIGEDGNIAATYTYEYGVGANATGQDEVPIVSEAESILTSINVADQLVTLRNPIYFEAGAEYALIVENTLKSSKKYAASTANVLESFIAKEEILSRVVTQTDLPTTADFKLYLSSGHEGYTPIEGEDDWVEYYSNYEAVVNGTTIKKPYYLQNVYGSPIPVISELKDSINEIVEDVLASENFAAVAKTYVNRRLSLGKATVLKVDSTKVVCKLNEHSDEIDSLMSKDALRYIQSTNLNTSDGSTEAALLANSYNDLASLLEKDRIKPNLQDIMLNIKEDGLYISDGIDKYYPFYGVLSLEDVDLKAIDVKGLAEAYIERLNRDGNWDLDFPVVKSATEVSTELGKVYVVPAYSFGSTTLHSLDELKAEDITEDYASYMDDIFPKRETDATFYYVADDGSLKNLKDKLNTLGDYGLPTRLYAEAYNALENTKISFKKKDFINSKDSKYCSVSSNLYKNTLGGHSISFNNLNSAKSSDSVEEFIYQLQQSSMKALEKGLYFKMSYFNDNGSNKKCISQDTALNIKTSSYSVKYYTDIDRQYELTTSDLLMQYFIHETDSYGDISIKLTDGTFIELNHDFQVKIAQLEKENDNKELKGKALDLLIPVDIERNNLETSLYAGSKSVDLNALNLVATLLTTTNGYALALYQKYQPKYLDEKSHSEVWMTLTGAVAVNDFSNNANNWSFILTPEIDEVRTTNSICGWHHNYETGEYDLCKVWTIPHRLLTKEYLNGNFFFFRE